MDKFILHSQYKPMGDQPQAIAELTDGVNRGFAEQTLLGVTGSGKTFTMANVIANLNRPPPFRNLCALRTARCYNRRQRVVHIQLGRPYRLPQHGHLAPPRNGKEPR